MSSALKSKRLLVICHDYANFTKANIELIAPLFESVNVLVRYKPVAELSRFLPIHAFTPYRKQAILQLDELPDNVHVHLTPLHYLPIDSSYRKLGAKHFRAVTRQVRQLDLQWDLIHTQFAWTAGYVGALLKQEYGTPLVITGQGYDIYDLPFRDPDWRERIEAVLNLADHLIMVGNSTLECVHKLGIDRPASVLPNGFLSSLFFPRDAVRCRRLLRLPADRKIVLAIGSLDPVKGHCHLVDAMSQVSRVHRDALCLIVGAGGLHRGLSRQIRRLGLQQHVRLVGGRPHQEMPVWINACDLFVLSSLAEGQPTVLFECLGCGRPFIGTRVGCVPDVITSPEYGSVVEPADAAGLADHILAGLSRDWDSSAIAAHAQQYTTEGIASRVADIYAGLLKSSPRRELSSHGQTKSPCLVT